MDRLVVHNLFEAVANPGSKAGGLESLHVVLSQRALVECVFDMLERERFLLEGDACSEFHLGLGRGLGRAGAEKSYEIVTP